MSKASELAARVRIVSNMINMGEKIRWGEETALMDQSADLIEAQEKTIEAVRALLSHWDEGSGPEKRGTFEDVEYWSPAGRMVDTQFIADLRQALASIDKGEGG